MAAVDVAEDKLALAKSLGAEVLVNGAREDTVAAIQTKIGGAHVHVVEAAPLFVNPAFGLVFRNP